MTYPEEKYTYLMCECGASEHEVKLLYFPDTTDNYIDEALYVTFYLKSGNFWKRLFQAIKFMLRKGEPYGHFTDTILSIEEVNKLQEFLKSYQDFNNERKITATEIPKHSQSCGTGECLSCLCEKT